VVERAANRRSIFFFGWLAGGTANLAGFYWLPYTITVFGGFPGGVSHIIFLIFAGLEAIRIGSFVLAVHFLGFGPLCLFPALLWIALEYWYPDLFPWQLASSQSQLLSFIQSADLVGPYGTSFLLVWANSAIYHALSRRRDGLARALRPVLVVALLVAAALFYGYRRLETVSARMRAAPKLAVAVVQGNIGVGLKWDPVQAGRNLNSYKELTEVAGPASLVIWPETAVEVWVPENLRQLPPEILPPPPPGMDFFIFGARSYRGDFAAADARFFNSAFLTDRNGRVLGFYHKQVLLAFGEYIPFSRLLSKIPGVPPLGGFSEGEAPKTLDLAGGIRVAPLICYEDLMPFLARGFVREKGAHLLVNLTNDAWYGDSAAPWQHARLSQWRAIETRRSLVRATNTGLTALIDARGEIRQSLPLFAPGILRAEVELLEGETFYVRFGDWLPWLATLFSLAVFLQRRRVWRKRER